MSAVPSHSSRRRPALLTASALQGVLAAALLAAPLPASAADECGAPSNGVVTCPAQAYPNGITYDVNGPVTVAVADGATTQEGLFLRKLNGAGDLVVQAPGATFNEGDRDQNAVDVRNPGGGDIVISSGVARATGSFQSSALLAGTATGSIRIDSGVASATGDASEAIVALARNDVTITARQTSTSGNAVDIVTDSNGVQQPGAVNGNSMAGQAAGIAANSSHGSITINTGRVTATGFTSGVLASVGPNSLGSLTVNVTGNIDANVSAINLAASNNGPVNVTVQQGRTVRGGYQGVRTVAAGQRTIINRGTIEQTLADPDRSDTFYMAAVNLADPQEASTSGLPVQAIALENYGSILAASDGVRITNGNGTIFNRAGASLIGHVGIAVTPNAPGQLRLLNITNETGATIRGTGGVAIDMPGGGTGGASASTIENYGLIDGDMILGGGAVHNFGTIDGSLRFNVDHPARNDMYLFAEGATITGSIDAGDGVDAYGRIFTKTGTFTLGALPSSFEIFALRVLGEDTIATMDNQAGFTGPATLNISGDGHIVNRADLSTSFGHQALYQTDLIVIGGPTNGGARFVTSGGLGLASFVNEGSIDGRFTLTTAEFVNSGSIALYSAQPPSIITANRYEDFSFLNTGSITLTDNGARSNQPAPDNAFDLIEPAVTIRSAAAVGGLPGNQPTGVDTIYHDVSIANAADATIDGGMLVRMTAETFAFDNAGSISGFANDSRNNPGLTIALGMDFETPIDLGPQDTRESLTATFANSGTIADGVEAYLMAQAVSFTNAGTVTGNVNAPDSLYLEQFTLDDDATDAASLTFVNAASGVLDGNVAIDSETTTATIANHGKITGRELALNPQTFSEALFGGEFAIDISNETSFGQTLTFVNTGQIVNTGHAAGAVAIEGDADEDAPAGDIVAVNVVNSGTISATGGATLITREFAPWLEEGQVLGNPLAGLAVDATDAPGESTITIENQAGGLIEAGGPIHVARPNGYFIVPVEETDVLAVAIHASGKTVNIVNAGTIKGGPGTVHNPNVILDDVELRDNYLAGAIHTAGGEYEVSPGGPEVYVASVDHLTNTATGTITGSIDLGGNDDRIDNAGTITGDVFLRDGNDVLATTGTLTGNVDLGAGDDVLELSESAIIDGTIDLGDGDDRVVLAFAEGVTTGSGAVAATVNAERLVVDSGSWAATGPEALYQVVEVGNGAILKIGEDADGNISLAAPLFQVDGRIDLDFSGEVEAGAVIAGSGAVHQIGEATIEINGDDLYQHTGGTFVDNGTLVLNAAHGGDITTSGDGVFDLGTTGDFTGKLVNNGTFVFTRDSDYRFLGNFSGSGALRKDGDSTLTFAGLYTFEGTTTVLGGTVAFTGQLAEDAEIDLEQGTVDLSQVEGGEQTIAGLEGTGGTLQLGETQLNIDQTGNSVFSGQIQGTGAIVKTGDGDLKLDGDGTGFTGTGQVQGGTLSVNGNFANANFDVGDGGRLGGAGTVGDTNINGGTLAPGNSIDTLTVNGDLAFSAASTYEVEVDAAGNADRIDASGTATLGGARVSVIAESGAYRPLTDYTILTADGGVTGTFASVEANLAFLDPSLSYTANAVTLRLVRNDIDFAAFAAGSNQLAVANLINSLGYGNSLYNETLTLVDSDVAVSFASLTGEVYPAYGAALIETAEILRRQTRDAAQGDGAYAWATALYNNVDSGKGPGNIELAGQGAAGGIGFGSGGVTAMAGLGKLDQDRGGSQFSDGEVTFAIARVGWSGTSGVSVSAGAQFGWVDAQTRRQTSLGAISQAVSGEIEGDYVQLFGELAYQVPLGSLVAEPFAGISHVSLDLEAVTETGAATALAIGASDREVTFADIGLRLSGTDGPGVRPFASAAYRHAWGDRASVAAFGFAGMAGTGLVGAVPIAKSSAELGAGVVITSGTIDFEIGYDGTLSKGFDSHGLSAGLKLRF